MNTALPITTNPQKTYLHNAMPRHVDKDIIPTLPVSTPQPQPLPELRILRIKEVAEKLSIGKSTIYDWINKKSPRYDETFPKPIKLSSKSIGWLSTEIDAWLLAKAEQTRVCDFG